jgi:hypothetical protein
MNIQQIEITDSLTGENVIHVIIDHGNDQFTSMLKSTWDELEAAKEAQSLQGGIN